MRLSKTIQGLFKGDNRKVNKPLLFVFLVVNFLVSVNSLIHNPEMGYDAEGHLNYITVLPVSLPSFEQSTEFFSPPLPYLFPSLVYHPCVNLFGEGRIGEGTNYDCRKVAGKFAQLVNVFLSLGCTLLVLLIADVIRPNSRTFKITALSLLGVLTVYYKTFAQVRGEPYVALFVLFVVYLVAKWLTDPKEVHWKNGAIMGILLGLLILSRQWGFLVLPALASLPALVWLKDRKLGVRIAKMLALSAAFALIIGGWFYVYLRQEFGSFAAFNQTPTTFSLANEPASFYRNTGLEGFMIFKDPLRPTFDNQFIPIFYSDIWGDYWGFFVFIRDQSYLGPEQANRDEIAPYLGRVNLAATLPSLALFGGFVTGASYLGSSIVRRKKSNSSNLFFGFLVSIIVFSMIGFLYFVISYPVRQGDTVKATYMLHIFTLLPFLGAEFIDKLETRWPGALKFFALSLFLVFLYNLPAMLSRYH